MHEIGLKERFIKSRSNLLFALSVFWFAFRVIAKVKRKFRIILERKRLDYYSNLSVTAAVFWFLVRVLPKPSRITYPCQRATLSLLLVKVGIVLSSALSIVTDVFKRKSVRIVCFCVLVGIIVAEPAELMYYQLRYSILAVGNKNLTLADISVDFPSDRVVRVHSDNATSWDFSTGYYWEYVDQPIVDQMVEEGVKALTDASDAQGAWQTIMSSYVPGHKVGIKINGNDWWNVDDREIDSLPQLTSAVIKGLKSIGIPESDIYIIENTFPSIRRIREYYTNIITARYPNVVFQYDTNTNPTYGNVPGTEVNFPYTATRRINDQIATCNHLILMPIMKAITPIWGITGSIKLMQGVIEDVGAFHGWLARETDDNPNVLMYQNPHIINKTRLIVGDGLFGTWTGIHFTGGWGGVDDLNSAVNDIPKPWITFNNGAPNLFFFAIDPVAIDSVMYDHILSERDAQDQVPGQSLAPFNEPQLIAGEAAGLGIREHGPPYTEIDYIEIELGAPADTTPPAILILSPENKTYPENNVPLTFTLDEPTDWISYSLDGQTNVTISGNTTIVGLSEGIHTITVYANDTAGFMGYSDTVYFTVDTTPPNITDVSQTPLEDNVLDEDEVKINATVTDELSGVKQVTLNYTDGNGTWIIVNMTNLGGNVWNATIPAFPYCTSVTYAIIAEDNIGNIITTEEMGYEYQYHVIPEFPSFLILPLFVIATLLTVIVCRRKQLM